MPKKKKKGLFAHFLFVIMQRKVVYSYNDAQ